MGIDGRWFHTSSEIATCSHGAAQHSVHPTGGSLRVFRQFAWLEADSGKAALSRLAHPRVTLAVGQPRAKVWSLFFIVLALLLSKKTGFDKL